MQVSEAAQPDLAPASHAPHSALITTEQPATEQAATEQLGTEQPAPERPDAEQPAADPTLFEDPQVIGGRGGRDHRRLGARSGACRG